ncbi:hypothetical protein [uncultured Bilophila sp.]|uniref:hypothetical protein n=1 Tax=uncultured Bilophila sp. TaxID=529385 RepID=UPI0025D0FD6F|nr:hypothetical protein [uncultured Bilophila sp.]
MRAEGFDAKTRDIADGYLHKAQDALAVLRAGLPGSVHADILASLIGYVRDREA